MLLWQQHQDILDAHTPSQKNTLRTDIYHILCRIHDIYQFLLLCKDTFLSSLPSCEDYPSSIGLRLPTPKNWQKPDNWTISPDLIQAKLDLRILDRLLAMHFTFCQPWELSLEDDQLIAALQRHFGRSLWNGEIKPELPTNNIDRALVAGIESTDDIIPFEGRLHALRGYAHLLYIAILRKHRAANRQ